MRRSGNRGFTLIELLVVIAIIAILAAILFPVFAQARKQAMLTQCQSNVRQLHLAIQMYTDDYDQHLPGFTFYMTVFDYTIDSKVNGGAGYGYIRSQDIFLCPMDNRVRKNFGNKKGTYSYTINGYLVGETPYDMTRRPGQKLSRYGNPSHTPSVVEERSKLEDDSYWDINNPEFCCGDRTTSRHNGKATSAFLDGHVKMLEGNLDWLKSRWDDGTFVFCPDYK